MKKINIIAVILVFSTALSVFGNTPVLENRMDSLNYALGVANGGSVRMFYMNNNVTEEGIQSLMKGMDRMMNNNSEFYELEMLGENMGSTMRQQNETGLMGIEGVSVSFNVLRQGLINGIRGYEGQMTVQEANAFLQLAMRESEAQRVEKLFGENKKTGEDFLAENAMKEGVVTLPSGLQYKIIKEGKGEIPTIDSHVLVHYHGTLIDGTVFDSSVDRGEPIDFPVKGVIAGWTEALQFMPVGSKWILYIPQNLAYGTSDMGTIKPYSTLIFEVELLKIEE